MKTLRIFLCIGIIALATSCNKKTDDTSAPVLSLTTPTASQVYAGGANVSITGTVTDNSLHELKITIINTTNSAVLYTKTISVHGFTAYTINESWINSVSAITNAAVKVEAEDIGSNRVEKTAQVVLNP